MKNYIDEVIAEFDEKFTENGNGWSSPNIYRDGGRNVISALKSFLTTALKEQERRIKEDIAAKLLKEAKGTVEGNEYVNLKTIKSILTPLPSSTEEG